MERTSADDSRHRLYIGTRGSALALAQAEQIQALLQAAHPHMAVQIEIIHSLGDTVPDRPLASFGAQGIFTHALEEALRRGVIDVAVHSAKDLPSMLAPDLCIAAVSAREDPRDCLLTAAGHDLDALERGARLGTGSPRRMAQMRRRRPDLRFEPLRGNVDTRRRAALEGRLDGVVLAMAGLSRLGLLDEHVAALPTDLCLPQAGQGALALETRSEDTGIRLVLQAAHDATTGACVAAERAVLAGLAAGCQAPVAAFAEPHAPGRLRVRGLVAVASGVGFIDAGMEGDMADAEQLGRTVAARLNAQGAAALLAEARVESL